MKTVTIEQMKDLDWRTINQTGVPGRLLMDRAGYGVARSVKEIADCSGAFPAVLLVAGKGNNGGDVFSAARYLLLWGFDVAVRLAGRAEDLQGDAQFHYERMLDDGIVCLEMPEEIHWQRLNILDETCAVVVDGLLGTGATGTPHGAVAAAIDYINQLAEKTYVVSVDIPSGMNGDDGSAAMSAVRADITVTMGAPKVGFTAKQARKFCGSLRVIDIGIPYEYVEQLDAANPVEIMTFKACRELIWRRAADAHKGVFGHCLLIGGSIGCSGAIALSARGALRAGVGLTTVVTPEPVYQIVASYRPEIMVHPAPATASGALSAAFLDVWADKLNDYDAVLLGPGLSNSEDSHAIVLRVIRECTKVVVLDADALNALGDPSLLKEAVGQVIVTPHPGEMARLLDSTTAEVQADRLAAVERVVESSGATVVLKGDATLVAQKERGISMNLTGNPEWQLRVAVMCLRA